MFAIPFFKHFNCKHKYQITNIYMEITLREFSMSYKDDRAIYFAQKWLDDFRQ